MHLSTREKVLIVLLVVVAVVALGFQFLIAPQKTLGTELMVRLDNTTSQYVDLVNKAGTLETLRENLENSKENAVTVAAQFPDVRSAEELDADLHAWLERCNLNTVSLTTTPLAASELAGFLPLPDAISYPAGDALGQVSIDITENFSLVSDPFPCVRFALTFTGEYDGLMDFLDIVAAQGDGYHLDSLNFEPWDEDETAASGPAQSAQDDQEPAPDGATSATGATGATGASAVGNPVKGTAVISVYMVDKPNFDAMFGEAE